MKMLSNVFNMDFFTIIVIHWSIWGHRIMASLWDLAVVLLGSFFALLIALFIYRRQEKSTLMRLKNEQRQEYLNRIKCFLLFINSIIENARTQSKGYNELISKIKDDPYEIHVVKLSAFNDLRRVSQMDSEGLFAAYTYLFESNIESIKQYVKLFKCIDFVEILLKETFASLERHHSFIHNDRTQVKDLFNELADNVSSVLYNIGFNYLPHNEFVVKPLKNSLEVYRELTKEESSLIKYELSFSKPLRAILVKEFGHLSFADIIVSKSQRASNLLYNIRYNSLAFSDEVDKGNKELINAIDELSLMYSTMIEKVSVL